VLKQFVTFLFVCFFVAQGYESYSQTNLNSYENNYSIEHFYDEISETKTLLEQDLFHCRSKAAEIYIKTNAIYEKTNILGYKEIALEAAFLYAVTFTKDYKFHKAHNIYESVRSDAAKFGFLRLVALVSNAYGASYYTLEYYDLAEKEFNIALKTAEFIGDSSIQGIVIGNMGMLMLSSGNHYAAIEYFDKSLKYCHNSGRISGEIIWLANTAITYLELERYDDAQYYFLRAIKLAEENEMMRLVCMSYMYMADLKSKSSNYQEAIMYAQKAILMAKDVERHDVLHGSYTILTAVYDSIGNLDSAFYYAKKSIEMGELLSADEHDFQKAEVLSAERFRNENKQLEIEKNYQKQIIDKSKTQSIYLLIVIMLVIIVLIILFISHRNRVRINNLLNKKNEDLNSTVLDLKLSEKQLTVANNAKDKFIGILSHDVLTPISSIKNALDGIVNNYGSYDNDYMFSLLNNARAETKELQSLINNILKWASFREKKFDFTPKLIDLHILSVRTISQLEGMAARNNINIENDVEEGSIVFADPKMITAVLRNLLSNAIKFSKQNSIIKVYSRSSDDELSVFVQDYGLGMTESDVQKLFRLDVDNKTIGVSKNKGTGLGLLLCMEILKMNTGKIHVESELGKGSVFSFTLKKNNRKNE